MCTCIWSKKRWPWEVQRAKHNPNPNGEALPREDAEQRDPGTQADERGERRRGGRRTQERTSEEHRTEPSDGRGRRQAEGHREGERRTRKTDRDGERRTREGEEGANEGRQSTKGRPLFVRNTVAYEQAVPPSTGQKRRKRAQQGLSRQRSGSSQRCPTAAPCCTAARRT